MRNNIFVLSRENFKKLLKEDMHESKFMKSAFISIHEPGNNFYGAIAKPFPVILEDSENVLNLWFNDCEEPCPEIEAVLFNEEMANKIVEFVEKNKGATNWFIHCTMGKCRSGAVGECLSDYFGINYYKFKRDNPQVQPNMWVKKLINNALNHDIV